MYCFHCLTNPSDSPGYALNHALPNTIYANKVRKSQAICNASDKWSAPKIRAIDVRCQDGGLMPTTLASLQICALVSVKRNVEAYI